MRSQYHHFYDIILYFFQVTLIEQKHYTNTSLYRNFIKAEGNKKMDQIGHYQFGMTELPAHF